MMDFDRDPQLDQLCKRYRVFIDTHVLPLEARFLEQGFGAIAADIAAVRERAQAEGLFGPQLPESLGGMALGLTAIGEISAVLGRTPLGHYCMHLQAPDVSNMELLHRWGTPMQHHQWLEPLCKGEIRSCFSMTEPDHAGSNPVLMSTTAVRDGDDWLINGKKWFTSSADGAAFAIVMAVTDAAAPPHQRATFFLVPSDTPGFTVVRNLPVMGEAHAVGHAGWASHAEVTYEGVRIPDAYRIGEVGAGFAMAQERLGPGRIHHAMRWIGIAERSLELMVQRAATRALSATTMLGHKDTVQGWIADSFAELEAARLMVRKTAWTIERHGQKAAKTEVSAIKFFVANMLDRVLDRALQVHGALGMTDLLPIAFWYRHERAARIYDGPDEVHKGVVARLLLEAAGMPRGTR